MSILYFVFMVILFFYSEYYLSKNKDKVLRWLCINENDKLDSIIMPQILILLVILAYPFLICIVLFVLFGNLIKKMFENTIKL